MNLFNENEMREKLLKAVSIDNDYTMDEFNNEFSNVSTTYMDENKIYFGFDVKIVNKSNNEDPSYATNGSAGFDFRANLTEPLEIPGTKSGNNIVMVPTGLYFEIPPNLELQVRPRSGLAAKHGITVLNSPGTVDSDYRGEVKVILINHKPETFTINPGDRIAQGVISSVLGRNMIRFNKVSELSDTERGTGGFGSTGVK
jgi:dUTP pyrophosphatase